MTLAPSPSDPTKVQTPASTSVSPFYSFHITTMQGLDIPCDTLAGKVVLIVNTASACGFTPQLAGLQSLHKSYAEQGLVVLGFPCNQFGQQDPGTHEAIADFCQRNYGVEFAMMAKIDVNGAQAHPLFQWLKAQAPGLLGSQGIKWNFTKFLVGRDVQVIRRYGPQQRPEAITNDIEAALTATHAST
jgi:glutathione peroxidase